MKRLPLPLGPLVLLLAGAPDARADIPAGYAGKPFNPAVAGGPMLPSGVKAGPYAVPGRLEFENHDMGGIGVGFFTTDHISCGAAGYRTDDGTQEASLCLTSPTPYPKYTAPNGDVWYDTGESTLDGTTYPSATTTSVYIGAVRPGDWVNITVDVQTAGTYQVGSTWASGNGPLGLEGGNGSMELQVSVNGTMALDWKDVFPDYQTTANFKHWKPYPNMGTISLEAGVQVIKLDTGADPHLNLDYVLLSLVLPDGGLDNGGGNTGPTPMGGDAGSEQADALAPLDASTSPPGPEGGAGATIPDAAPDAAVGAESPSAEGMEAGTPASSPSQASGCGGCVESAALAHQESASTAASLVALGLLARRRKARRQDSA
jgi:hypothetical protein